MNSGPIIGIVGQVCAGKSRIAAALHARGAIIYDADSAVHALYKLPDVIEHLRELFGSSIIDEAGMVDRRALGKIVFADMGNLRMLTERVVFPRIAVAMQESLAQFHRSTAPVLVLDAPTLFEAGRQGLCSHILFVAAPIERRKEWGMARGWKSGEIEHRDKMMIVSEEIKRARASAIVDNDGSLEDLDRKIVELFERWTKQGQR